MPLSYPDVVIFVFELFTDPDSTSYGWSVRITGKIGDDTDVTEKAQTAGLTSDQQHTHRFRTNTTAARHMATRKRTARHSDTARHGISRARHSDTARHGISRHHGARHGTAYPGTMVRGEFIYGMARGTTVRDNTARHDTRHDGARQYEIRHDTTCGTMVRDIRHDMTRGMMARDNTARHDDTACGTMVRDNTARHDDTTCGTMVRDNTNEYGTKHGTI